MLKQPRAVLASLSSALARSLSRYNTSVPNVVRRSLTQSNQVSKLRSAATSSIHKEPVARSRNTHIMRCKNVSSTAPMTGRLSP
jgi:hypothetical protein